MFFFRKIDLLFNISKNIKCTLSKTILDHINSDCLENCYSLSLLLLYLLSLFLSHSSFSFLYLFVFDCFFLVFVIFFFHLDKGRMYYIKLRFELFMKLSCRLLHHSFEKYALFYCSIPFLDPYDTVNGYFTICSMIEP